MLLFNLNQLRNKRTQPDQQQICDNDSMALDLLVLRLAHMTSNFISILLIDHLSVVALGESTQILNQSETGQTSLRRSCQFSSLAVSYYVPVILRSQSYGSRDLRNTFHRGLFAT